MRSQLTSRRSHKGKLKFNADTLRRSQRRREQARPCRPSAQYPSWVRGLKFTVMVVVTSDRRPVEQVRLVGPLADRLHCRPRQELVRADDRCEVGDGALFREILPSSTTLYSKMCCETGSVQGIRRSWSARPSPRDDLLPRIRTGSPFRARLFGPGRVPPLKLDLAGRRGEALQRFNRAGNQLQAVAVHPRRHGNTGPRKRRSHGSSQPETHPNFAARTMPVAGSTHTSFLTRSNRFFAGNVHSQLRLPHRVVLGDQRLVCRDQLGTPPEAHRIQQFLPSGNRSLRAVSLMQRCQAAGYAPCLSEGAVTSR